MTGKRVPVLSQSWWYNYFAISLPKFPTDLIGCVKIVTGLEAWAGACILRKTAKTGCWRSTYAGSYKECRLLKRRVLAPWINLTEFYRSACRWVKRSNGGVNDWLACGWQTLGSGGDGGDTWSWEGECCCWMVAWTPAVDKTVLHRLEIILITWQQKF